MALKNRDYVSRALHHEYYSATPRFYSFLSHISTKPILTLDNFAKNKCYRNKNCGYFQIQKLRHPSYRHTNETHVQLRLFHNSYQESLDAISHADLCFYFATPWHEPGPGKVRRKLRLGFCAAASRIQTIILLISCFRFRQTVNKLFAQLLSTFVQSGRECDPVAGVGSGHTFALVSRS